MMQVAAASEHPAMAAFQNAINGKRVGSMLGLGSM